MFGIADEILEENAGVIGELHCSGIRRILSDMGATIFVTLVSLTILIQKRS
jgi:hypothetical protein